MYLLVLEQTTVDQSPNHHFETVAVKMTDLNIDKKVKSANNAWLQRVMKSFIYKMVDMLCSGAFHQNHDVSVILGKPESIEVESSSSGKKKAADTAEITLNWNEMVFDCLFGQITSKIHM